MVQVTNQSKKVGRRIRDIRERLKDKDGKVLITQEELADRAGLNRAYIGYIERGERNASTETLSKIAKALKVPIHELFK